jgi:hypothetical protein
LLPWLDGLAAVFAFVPLPGEVVLASVGVVAGYVVANEAVKRRWPRLWRGEMG